MMYGNKQGVYVHTSGLSSKSEDLNVLGKHFNALSISSSNALFPRIKNDTFTFCKAS